MITLIYIGIDNYQLTQNIEDFILKLTRVIFILYIQTYLRTNLKLKYLSFENVIRLFFLFLKVFFDEKSFNLDEIKVEGLNC